VPRFLVLLFGLVALAGCGATSSSKATDEPVRTRPIRIHFVDWRSNQNLVLLDQSHTDRSELYSSQVKIDEAGTKVTTDEVLEETVRFFREEGFFDHAVNGKAGAGGDVVQTLEVETPDGTVHFRFGRSTDPESAKIFRTCRDNFVALYNNVYQLQSVDRVPDWEAQNQKTQLGLKKSRGAKP
jgi:hypothetical protein